MYGQSLVHERLPCLAQRHRSTGLPRCPVLQVTRLWWRPLLLRLLGTAALPECSRALLGGSCGCAVCTQASLLCRSLARPTCGCCRRRCSLSPACLPVQPPGLSDAQAVAEIVPSVCSNSWPHGDFMRRAVC